MFDLDFFEGSCRCAISISIFFVPLVRGVMSDSWSLPRTRSGRAATVVDELLDPEGHAACE
jgi:hypothetical protein